MRVESPSGPIAIESSKELVDLLSSAGLGECATFYCYHVAPYPWLSVHLNELFAYVHYFPVDQHPGFQAQNMTPQDCPDEVRFHHGPGVEGDPIEMPQSSILHRDQAITAAVDFLGSIDKPESVDWFEL